MTLLTFFIALAAFLAVSVAAARGFRALATMLTRGNMQRALRNAPLTACFGMLVILIYLVIALLAPVIAPFPERAVIGSQFMPWSSTHWLGTDALGRDMFSRMVYGTRNTVGIAFATTALAFLIGSVLGLLAATVGGWLDQGLSRLVDVLMAIPSLIFAL
ncbi:MAG: ABC transporter permease, partial [Rhodobacteraceae bacterium]